MLTGQVERLTLFETLLDGARRLTDLPLQAVHGRWNDTEVAVLGTGMGGPATVRALRVAAAFGASVVVRAGGAGPVGDHVSVGDHLIATAAVRDEGASHAFLGLDQPAAADPGVIECLCVAARSAGLPVRVGVVHSKDAFFGEMDPAASPVSSVLQARWSAWRRLGVLGSEMEAAALFAAGPHYGFRAGAILRVNDVDHETGGLRHVETTLCDVALTGAVAAVARRSP